MLKILLSLARDDENIILSNFRRKIGSVTALMNKISHKFEKYRTLRTFLILVNRRSKICKRLFDSEKDENGHVQLITENDRAEHHKISSKRSIFYKMIEIRTHRRKYCISRGLYADERQYKTR